MVAHAIGDIVAGDTPEAEVVVSASPSVGGLLDSLTGSIGISSISARAKPVAAPVPASSTSSAALGGAIASDAPRIGFKDTLQNFISSSMPFGRYSLLWYFPPQIYHTFGYIDRLTQSNGYILHACWPLYRYTLGPQLFKYFCH